MRPFASRAQLTQYVERCVVLVFDVDVVLAVVECLDEPDLRPTCSTWATICRMTC
jgi:hypothetical protein